MFKGFCNGFISLGKFLLYSKVQKILSCSVTWIQSKAQDKIISFKDMFYQDVAAVC